ncbi:MAG TPA: integrin alpha [Acidimicrobiales bacterium]|nr:integrin alpha [Acidimicrobiales bacterium]
MAGLFLAGQPGFASTAATPYVYHGVDAPDAQPTGRWAERTASAGDLNGDGTPDIWVGAPSLDVGTMTNAGRVYAVSGTSLVSGSTPTILYTIDDPEPQPSAQFGFFISNVGDSNADGKADIVIGTDAQDIELVPGACTFPSAPEPNNCNENQGKAWLFNGANGAMIRAFDNPNPQGASNNSARFGSRIGQAKKGKWVIIGASGNDSPPGCGNTSPVPAGCRKDQGQAFIFNVKTGALVRTLDMPAADRIPATCSSSCGSFGLSVQGPGDTDGDGIVDQMVAAGSYNYYTGSGTPCGDPEPNGCNETQGRMYVFSGATGALLLSIDDPVPQVNVNFGFQDAAPLSPGDVNGDGFADLYGNGFTQNGPAGQADGGRAWVFNGKTGAVLYELLDPTPTVGGQFGWSMAKTDYNLNGKPDLYVGSSPHHLAGPPDQSGGTYVFKGSNGAVFKILELGVADRQPGGPPTLGLGSNLGWSIAAPGDLNGDGNPDYVAGTPFQDVGTNQDQGVEWVFLSQ